jgi:hypothetical protein
MKRFRVVTTESRSVVYSVVAESEVQARRLVENDSDDLDCNRMDDWETNTRSEWTVEEEVADGA